MTVRSKDQTDDLYQFLVDQITWDQPKAKLRQVTTLNLTGGPITQAFQTGDGVSVVANMRIMIQEICIILYNIIYYDTLYLYRDMNVYCTDRICWLHYPCNFGRSIHYKTVCCPTVNIPTGRAGPVLGGSLWLREVDSLAFMTWF